MTATPALRVLPPPAQVDLAAAERAAADLLHALGIETDSESLRGTPGRIARAYAELFSSDGFDLTTFPNDEGYDELVLARSIPLRAVCEHHLLPFIGVAHLAYVPGKRIAGLGRLTRVVETLSSRPQLQERLGEQIADTIAGSLDARGVLVVLDATHECVTMRGGRQPDAATITIAARGELAEPAARAEIIALLTAGGES